MRREDIVNETLIPLISHQLWKQERKQSNRKLKTVEGVCLVEQLMDGSAQRWASGQMLWAGLLL